jgi:hypothetical protein
MSETGTDDQDPTEPAATAPKRTRKTTPAARPKANPGGSTSKVRTELLLALGVLKIVNGDQMWRLLRPHAKGNKFARAGLNDLEKAGLVLSEGSTEDALKTWRLTPAGAVAAEQVLPTGRPVGSLAKGAGVHGAAHAMTVSLTDIAFVRGALEPEGAGAVGSITSWHTEYPIEMRAGLKVRPDAVLRAPEIGLPALLVEVDRHTENRPVLAAKFPAYAAVFAHQAKIPDPASRSGGTTTVAAWKQLFPDPVREGYPPVAVVFADNASETVTRNRMKALMEATREQWQGDRTSRVYTDYSRAVPIIVTTLGHLQQEGPLAAIWWRFGHTGRQTLDDALANYDDADAYWAKREEREQAKHLAQQDAERREQQRVARDATRCPVCRRAGDQFEDPDEASYRFLAFPAFPCQPCIRDRDQADLAAVVPALHDGTATGAEALAWSTPVTPAWDVLAYEAWLRAKAAYAAWQASRAARAEPEPDMPRAPQPRTTPGGVRTPAARTGLQALLDELAEQGTWQPAQEDQLAADPAVQPSAPRRAVATRGRTARPPAAPAPPEADDGWS